jgi:hypothetical protein
MRPGWLPDEPGDVIALALGSVGLGASVVLVRNGLRPVSTCIRTTTPLRIIAAGLLIHVVFRVPFDPLTAIGRRLSGNP